MKKALSLFLSFVLAISTLSFGAFTVSAAQSGTWGSLEWTLDDEGTLTISGEGEMDDFRSYSEDAWGGFKDSIKTVVINTGVTTVCGSAFSDCTALESVTIPNSVTSIGNYAFAYCDSLTSITIPASVTAIGSSALEYCFSLTSIKVDGNNTVYSDINGVLFNKDKTVLVIYPNGKTDTSYTIPDSVNTIGYDAFENSKLTEITIGTGVTTIDAYGFRYCSNLTSVTIPDGVITIGYGAFSDCTALESVTIPNSVTSIGNYAFAYCDSLTSITIPDSVTTVYSRAFWWCTSLTSITIPDSVTAIGEGVFYNTKYYNDENNWENGVLYIGKYLIEAKDNISGSYTIKDGTKVIADMAFSRCTALENVTISDSVTTIGNSAFFSCTVLNNLIIGNGVITIGDQAFGWCQALESVTIPDSVTTIDEGAFYWCTSLKNATISSSVTTIGKGAFGWCVSLETIRVNSENGVYCDVDGVLFNKDKTTIIQYPAGKKGTPYTVPDSVITIGESAFEYSAYLESIIISCSVTSIGPCAFDLSSLKTVYYCGSEAQWNSIEIGGGCGYENPLVDANVNIVYNYVPTLPKLETGDIDGDGYIDNTDAICVLKYDAGITELTEAQLAVADVNDDGYADNTDAIMILKYDAGIIDEL